MPYGVTPTMEQVWARFIWDVKNLFDPHLKNPYIINGEGDFKGAERTALQDITHAAKNVVYHFVRKLFKKEESGE